MGASPHEIASGPLFMVSMWRSGSSLLYALLNKHPKVALMYEADLMLLRPTFLKPGALCDWAERWEFWNDSFRRHGLTASDVEQGLTDFPAAFTAAHRLYADRQGATIWGDKSPNYYDRLNEMADDFPSAKFIIVWRDPKGTANSILRAAASGNSYFRRRGAALCGLLGNEVYKQECDRLVARGRAVCQVNYEDLIADTAVEMRRVCEFLEIEYDDSLASLAGADTSAVFEGKHHANVKGSEIVRAARPEVVSAGLREKIRRYVRSWHSRYGAEWPAYPAASEDTGASLGLSERLLDWAGYRVARLRDKISPFVFSFVPIAPLRKYRELKKRRRGDAAATGVGPEVAR